MPLLQQRIMMWLLTAFVAAVALSFAVSGTAKADSLVEVERAKDRETTLEQRLEKALPTFDHKDYVTLGVENDLFGDGRDRYYTSGVRLSWFKVGADMPEFTEQIDDILPTFDIDEKTSVFFSLGQNLYAPQDITIEANQDDERPWAAWLYGSMGLLTVTDDHLDEVELSLGVVGPYALGKQTQRLIHKNVDSPDPRGWKNQLKNEPGVILSWERRFPSYLSFEAADLWLDVAPSFGVALGNVYTHASAGVSFQIGPEYQRWQDMPMRVRPSMPGTGFFVPTSWSRVGWSIFGGAEARAVGRNIFIDGNSFRDSHSVDKEHFVYDLNGGVSLTYGPMRTSYTVVRRSKEFKGQDEASIFGGLSFSVQF